MSYKTGFYEGRLGIGLSSTMGMGDGNPRYPLDINGDIRLTGSIVNGDGQVLSLVPQESLWTIGNSNLSYTGGNVGIGTTNPDSILHLKSTGDVVLRLEADSNNSGENDNPMIFMSQDGTISQNNQYFKIGMNGDAGAAFTGALGNGAYLSSNDYIQFAVQGQAVMTMKYQNKYVGIGTETPGQKLEVNGNIKVTGSGSFMGGDFNVTTDVGVHLGSYINQYGNIQIVSSHENGGWIDFIKNNSGNTDFEGRIRYGTGDTEEGFTFHTAHAERMRIATDGNVGIGTDSPGSILHLKSNGCILNLETTEGNVNGRACYISFRDSDSNNGGEFFWLGDGSSGNKVIHLYSSRGDPIVLDNANVGIGTTSPAVLLDVNGHGWCRTLCVGSYGSFAGIDGGDTTKLQISNSSYNGDMSIEFSGYTNGHRGGNMALARIICRSNDSNNYENHKIIFKIRGWGTNSSPHHQPLNNRFQFDGNGSGYATQWSTFSDNRVKHNEKNITNAMDIINKLNAKLYFKSNDIKEHNYNYELDNSGNPITDEFYRLEAGFIAQELKEVPELKHCVEGKEYVDDFENCFKKDASGNNIFDENNEPVLIPEYLESIPNKLGVSYNDIFVYNVAATQELDKKLIALENENAELKTKNTELENKVSTLETELAAIKQHLGI